MLLTTPLDILELSRESKRIRSLDLSSKRTSARLWHYLSAKSRFVPSINIVRRLLRSQVGEKLGGCARGG